MLQSERCLELLQTGMNFWELLPNPGKVGVSEGLSRAVGECRGLLETI